VLDSNQRPCASSGYHADVAQDLIPRKRPSECVDRFGKRHGLLPDAQAAMPAHVRSIPEPDTLHPEPCRE